MTPTEQSWLRLHLTPGLGRVGIGRLLEAFGHVDAVLAAGPTAWRERARIGPAAAAGLPAPDDPDFLRTRDRLVKLGVRILSHWHDDRYPALLGTIFDPPALLYLRGRLPEGEALAVVGARRASPQGLLLAGEISRSLAERGLVIVSGLARGIDSAAHAGALDGGGDTVAVLGCGIDHIYPPENARLFQRLHEQGGILSEYPPGTQPLKGHFPGRNRIISGLCRGVLVVEAAQRSGSLITAEFALDQGREVFAVPGAVHTEGSQGVNRLLKDGAHLVTGAEDILAVLRPHLPLAPKPHRAPCSIEPLPEPERTVYDKLGPEPLHIDQLARKCALTPMDLSAILLHLELAGAVQQLPGMYFVRKQNL